MLGELNISYWRNHSFCNSWLQAKFQSKSWFIQSKRGVLGEWKVSKKKCAYWGEREDISMFVNFTHFVAKVGKVKSLFWKTGKSPYLKTAFHIINTIKLVHIWKKSHSPSQIGFPIYQSWPIYSQQIVLFCFVFGVSLNLSLTLRNIAHIFGCSPKKIVLLIHAEYL